MIVVRLFVLLYTVFFVVPGNVHSESPENCRDKAQEIDSVDANANTWDNFRNNPGSLRFETEKLLSHGMNILEPESKITITSVPKKFMATHRDNEYCSGKYNDTRNNPILFPDRKFNTTEELNSWISDFSQGKGSEGKELYRSCDKSCSPQYAYQIKKDNHEKLVVDAEVVCGPVRDKKDNNYVLTLSCGPEAD